jgi:hypothetical protein
MAEQFNEEDRNELIERGFNNEQIEYLESLEMDTEGLFSDICKIMDDFGDTPEQIIDSYREANNNNPLPSQGGRRRTRKNRKGRKNRKSHKRRSYKIKSHKRRSHKRRH